jgi:hypothetical protein
MSYMPHKDDNLTGRFMDYLSGATMRRVIILETECQKDIPDCYSGRAGLVMRERDSYCVDVYVDLRQHYTQTHRLMNLTLNEIKIMEDHDATAIQLGDQTRKRGNGTGQTDL